MDEDQAALGAAMLQSGRNGKPIDVHILATASSDGAFRMEFCPAGDAPDPDAIVHVGMSRESAEFFAGAIVQHMELAGSREG